MIVVDTNVLSELMRPSAAEAVLEWMAGLSAADLFTTALTQAEILYGVALLPEGKRKRAFAKAAEETFLIDFEGRVLSFDHAAAVEYAQVAAARRRKGDPISQTDAQIAAICRVYGARLATRNVKDFTGCGVETVNPWQVH